MKSKSLDVNQGVIDQVKENISFDFVKLYNSSAETRTQFESKHEANVTKEAKKSSIKSQSELDSAKRSRSPNKNKRKKANESLDTSNVIEPDHSSVGTLIISSNNTPSKSSNTKKDKLNSSVKSIMKAKTDVSTPVTPHASPSTSSSKTKKRNKSVSFMLDDTEEVVVKKSKSNESSKEEKFLVKGHKTKEKLSNKNTHKQKIEAQVLKTDKKLSKEQKVNDAINNDKNKVNSGSSKRDDMENFASGLKALKPEELVNQLYKKIKKAKKLMSLPKENVETTEDTVSSNQNSENKQKLKKKKRKVKSLQDNNSEADGEPAVKTRKREIKPETIAKGLENLNIGDNAHTLSCLLDEMTVTDKKKKRKNKQKDEKYKPHNNIDPNVIQGQQHTNKRDATKEDTEKMKWNNRKWNKDVKLDSKKKLLTSVVVENLPLSIMCSYKKQLSEHFAKFGTIIGVGVAEAYPNEDPKPVFTTTVYYQDKEAATKALQEDNTMFVGNRIRVRRPLPPSDTTLVVRTYAEVSDQAISSVFSSAGRIRAIRNQVKGKNSICTVFIEFDGPEAVERALNLTEDAKICGKKMYATKYEVRKANKFQRSEKMSSTEKNGDNNITY